MTGALDFQAWHDFWTFAGGASATFAGLVFVAITFRPGALLGTARGRYLARSTFFAFFLLIGMCAVGLMPWTSGLGAGLSLIAIALVGLVTTVFSMRRGDARATSLASVAPGVLARVIVLAGGAMLALENAYAFAVLAVAGAILMITAAQNAWALLASEMGSPAA